MELICTHSEVVEERGYCARRFGIDYGIMGPTEQACRENMERELGRSWKWLRLLGWKVGSFTVPRFVCHLKWLDVGSPEYRAEQHAKNLRARLWLDGIGLRGGK